LDTSGTRRIPVLTAEILADADALSTMIGELLVSTKTYRKLSKRVRRAQDRLQKVVTDKAWKRYMRLEEVVNERTGEETDTLVRWAFEAGVRHRVALGVRLVTMPLASAENSWSKPS
jgi:hypothetical protein